MPGSLRKRARSTWQSWLKHQGLASQRCPLRPDAGPALPLCQRAPHLREDLGLLAAVGDPHPLELAVELDIDVEVVGVLVEVQERPGFSREVAALALPQPGKLA